MSTRLPQIPYPVMLSQTQGCINKWTYTVPAQFPEVKSDLSGSILLKVSHFTFKHFKGRNLWFKLHEIIQRKLNVFLIQHGLSPMPPALSGISSYKQTKRCNVPFCINLHSLPNHFAQRRHSSSFKIEINKRCLSLLVIPTNLRREIYKSFWNNINMSLLVKEEWAIEKKIEQ